ncbi:MAG: AI-2E family transporter, partial [Campylobacterales bacterium]|nr:AI-2E family transporter [Campylobacterales bacterium]
MSNLNHIIIFFFGLALWGAYHVYEPFLFPIVIALLLTMATYNATAKLTKKVGGSRIASSFISTLMLFLLLFVPISYIAVVIIDYLSHVDQKMISTSTTHIKAILNQLP